MTSFGFWDWTLILVVSTQATVLAYLPRPSWKSFVMGLPIPFTLASLALGQRVDASHTFGLALLIVFAHAVRLLHLRLKVRIVPAIALCVLGYCIVGQAAAGSLPSGNDAFWLGFAVALSTAALLWITHPHVEELPFRTTLPVWLKYPIIALIVTALILVKQQLRGFMATFPMVSVIALYETRYSLRTSCRQFSILVIALAPALAVCRFVESYLSLGVSLIPTWIVYLAIVLPLQRWAFRTDASPAGAAGGGSPAPES